MAKQAEERVVGFFKHFGMGWHKYGDVRYCPHCGKPLPKSERAPDFKATIVGMWVEAKNNNAKGIWPWKEDIGSKGKRYLQRDFLTEHGGWLFIELGTSPVHKDPLKSGKSAFLVPWDEWLKLIEPKLEEKGMASIRKETLGKGDYERKGADELLRLYRLDWVPGEKKEEGRWIPPKGHIFWRRLYEELVTWVQFVETQLTS